MFLNFYIQTFVFENYCCQFTSCNQRQNFMDFDYLIVGKGLAGTVLAHTFLRSGKKVLVIDDEPESSSSHVAAGVFNPITGKRMVKSWKAEILFPYLLTFYKSIEEKLGARFLFTIPIYKPFSSIEEQNFWISQTAYKDFDHLLQIETNSNYNNIIQDASGGYITQNTGYVNLITFLEASKNFFLSKNSYINSVFKAEDLALNENSVSWKGIKAKKVIFCEGFKATNNPYFSGLPFVLAKGEVLTIKIEHFLDEVIFKKGVFILPIGNKEYKVGATYEWNFTHNDITEKAQKELTSKLEELIKSPYSILKQEAGIRPTVKDRRPIIGLHPKLKTLAIFNGLGTKGVSLAPYFANQLFRFLEMGENLENEVNIERFYSLLK